jgi:hypothetical protein
VYWWVGVGGGGWCGCVGGARGSRREWGLVVVGVNLGREGELVGAGMVVVVMAPRPETPPLPPVLVLVLVSLSVMVGVLGACACVRARELACAEPTRAGAMRCARIGCIWGG